MRNNALRLLAGLRAGSLREAARSSSSVCSGFSASRFLSVLSAASSSGALVLSQQQQSRLAPSLSLALNEALRCALHTSGAGGSAEALTEVGLEGDGEGVLAELDKVISAEAVTAAEVADVAVALTYLTAKGNRRLWGKVVEKAGAVKDSLDAASLTNLAWALTTAGVEHFKTVAELSGAVARLLPSLSGAQLSVVVEALGKAGVQDYDLFNKITTQVVAKAGELSAAQAARILWGYAAAGINDVAAAKALGKVLGAKAGEVGSREAAQGLWALAALGRVDKPLIDTLTKALKAKLGAAESAADAAGAAWALGQLAVKDAATGRALSDALKAGAGELSATQAIQAALGLGQLGGADPAAVSALFAAAAAAIDKAPSSFDVAVLAQLHAAAAYTPDAKLPPAVASYAEKAFGLAVDAARHSRGGYAQCFADDVADAVALAMGARYRPHIAAAKKAFPRAAPDGSLVEIAVDADASSKVAILAVGYDHLSSTTPATVLGSALAIAKVREAQGFKPVLIAATDFSGDAKAKAGAVLAAVKRAVPATGSKMDELARKLAEPFDPYA